jgi:hypothetical protein
MYVKRIAGGALAIALSGCGDSVESGPVPFKGSNSPAIEALQKSMAESVKNKDFLKKQVEVKPADPKTAEPKK